MPRTQISRYFETLSKRGYLLCKEEEQKLTMKSELGKFNSLIEDLEIAMMTTRRHDGHLRSRAMANQKRADGADLWFVTADETAELQDLAQDTHLNLAPLNFLRWISRSRWSYSSLSKVGSREPNPISARYTN